MEYLPNNNKMYGQIFTKFFSKYYLGKVYGQTSPKAFWKFEIFNKNICQIIINYTNKHNLPIFAQILLEKSMAK